MEKTTILNLRHKIDEDLEYLTNLSSGRSLHVFASKMRHNAMTIYYPKSEPPRNANRQQKWHDPPAHSYARSAWHADATATSIG